MDDAHAREVNEVLDFFQVDHQKGLTESQVAQFRVRYGANEIPEEEGTPFWKLVLKQFDDLLVKILIIAAIVSLALALVNGEHGWNAFLEPFVILLILVANASVGVITETNAEKAIHELKAYQADVATVLRNGRLFMIPASDLVPGDIVEVVVGCKVPADLRLIQILSSQLRVDQSILTGESHSVQKQVEATRHLQAVYQDKTCVLFSGTVVTVGRSRAIVVGTGTSTAIGKIRDAMSESSEEMTPLKKKLDAFGSLLSKVIAAICVLVWVVNIGHFSDPAHGGILQGAIYYFKIAVALAVAAIPEGLPAVVTTCLALGTKKMAKLNAIVRTLPSVETLGCTTVICSDKTGTLTTNMMSVRKICVFHSAADPSMEEFSVTGTTYSPEGSLVSMPGLTVDHPAENPCLLALAQCASLCNDATIQFNAEKGVFDRIGESTEVALKVMVEKIGLPGYGSMPTSLHALSKSERASYCNNHWENHFLKVSTVEFSRDRKMMSVLCVGKPTSMLFVKGAPESVILRCSQLLCSQQGIPLPCTMAARELLAEKLQAYGQAESLRCLALAYKPMPAEQQLASEDDENNLIFIGMVGMLDPPREEVKAAISTCRAAGIRVIVVTGDNKATAESVCHQIGLLDQLDNNAGKSFTASEFDQLSAQEKVAAINSMVVFSRVEPSHKSMLVDSLRANSDVVAMTGDGVNDAPALKKADIGIAMGSGTAVAKAASDMVLADDNFSTIVAAVGEGRAIFNNTRQFIRYMVSSNIGEVVCIFMAAALGMPETLIPVQLLWVNLVTDGLPATALGFNKQDRDVMKVKPRKMDDGIVNQWLFFRYLVVGVYVGLATVAAFAWWFMYNTAGPKLTWHQLVSSASCQGESCQVFKVLQPKTMAMSVLVVVEMFNALNNLSENQSLLTLRPWSNVWLLGAITVSMLLHFLILYVPPLAAMFSVGPLSVGEWKAVLYFSFPVIIVDEVLKLVSRRLAMPGRGKANESLSSPMVARRKSFKLLHYQRIASSH